MKTLKFLGGLLLAGVMLAGCGGGGDTLTAPTNPGGGNGGGSTAASIAVTSNVPQIPADGSSGATITAIVRDSNQNFVQGATVTFSANAGGLAVNASGVTDTNGAVTATLTSAGAAAGTTITVTARVGTTVSGSTNVGVVAISQSLALTTDAPQIPSDATREATITALLRGANNQALPSVAVNFEASSGVISPATATTDANGRATAKLNAATDPTNRRITVTARTAGGTSATIPVDVTGTALSVTGPQSLVLGNQGAYTVLLTNSGGTGIAQTQVTLTSARGNTLAPATVTTNASGQATFQLTATTAGSDTITASALGLTAQQAVGVSGQNFRFLSPTPATKVALGSSVAVTVQWDSNGAPQANAPVSFSATRGTVSASTVNTNGSGQASITISSNTAGPAVIQASGNGVAAELPIEFVATNPTKIDVQASPSAIATQAQSTITAVVRDAQNNLVADQLVNFNLTDPTNGSLSAASATTDSQGRAQVTYTSSSTSSANNGVRIDAELAANAAVKGFTTLTVGGRTVFLSLGTGNTINIENAAQYSIDYAVQAIDAQGNAVPNANIIMQLVPISYVKGQRVYVNNFWATVPSTDQANTPCPSEDVNRNGILDTGEDVNNNTTLEPGGNTASVTPGSGTTNAAGTFLTKVVYPKEYAYYVRVQLIATATVQGTESSTETTFLLPGASSDFDDEDTAPPGPISRFGTGTTCANPD